MRFHALLTTLVCLNLTACLTGESDDKQAMLDSYGKLVDDVVVKEKDANKEGGNVALGEAANTCAGALKRPLEGVDPKKDKIKTKKGKLSFAKAMSYCEGVTKKLESKETMGCGEASMELVGTGSGGNWGEHSLHYPGSRPAVYSEPNSIKYKPVECKYMPKGDKLPSDVKAYAGMIKNICGEKSLASTNSGFQTTKLNATTLERSVMVHCYIKDKRKWSAKGTLAH